jgi:hypothetical protein
MASFFFVFDVYQFAMQVIHDRKHHLFHQLFHFTLRQIIPSAPEIKFPVKQADNLFYLYLIPFSSIT